MLLPTVILHHLERTASHYDWLLANPTDPTGLLWTARLTTPPQHWRATRSFHLELIAAHRRAYLKYQGLISHNRGRVVRIDEGVVHPLLWTESRAMLDVRTRLFAGRVELRRDAPAHWRARVLPL